MSNFPSRRLRHFMWLYTLLWVIGLPVALLYLFWRARRDPLYRQHLGERFGFYGSSNADTVWVHAVSLGELRSAVPLIRRILNNGDPVVITTFTPAGRREACTIFAQEIATNRVHVIWVPFEFRWCYHRFFAAFKPKLGLVMEIEVWPVMVHAARTSHVSLYLCNAQYPAKSFIRDRTKSKWRADLMQGYAGAFVKSDLQKTRFADAGTPNIHVTGELRFDQHIPHAQASTGEALKAKQPRRIITITSVVAGEDPTYIALIKATRGPNAPLFVYVPRAPERFDETYHLLTDAGFNVSRRSTACDANLNGDIPHNCDVILGDSMGEMYFYLALCDQAIIGGSFVPKGAHNISEPLALAKPVILGPHTWTIEFPFIEAQAAGVATQVPDEATLITHIQSGADASSSDVTAFFATQSGAVDRTYRAIKAQHGTAGGASSPEARHPDV